MNEIGKTIKFETYKIVKNKFLLISFFVSFAVFIGVILFSALRYPLNDTQEHGLDREQTLNSYEKERSLYELFLKYSNGESVQLPPGVILFGTQEEWQKKYEYYDFLIRTQTVESDYLSYAEQGFEVEHRGSYVMYEMLKILGIVLPLFAILTAFYVFACDFGGGAAKHILASPVSRGSTFAGKTLFLCALNLFILLLFLIVPAAFGLNDLSARFLLYGANGPRSRTFRLCGRFGRIRKDFIAERRRPRRRREKIN